MRVNGMCDEREQLIDYVYDECDPRERVRIDAHLAGCNTCQAELGSLRRVRQDLLAWDVPEHGSVWRPFAPPPSLPSWRDIPAWAMAAAAGIIFMAGAAGGMATRVLVPAPTVPVVAAQTAPPAVTAPPATLTDADLARLESRVLDRVRTQVIPRAVGTGSTSSPELRQVVEHLAELEKEYANYRANQLFLNMDFDRKLKLLSSRTSNIDDRLDFSRTAYQQVSSRLEGR